MIDFYHVRECITTMRSGCIIEQSIIEYLNGFEAQEKAMGTLGNYTLHVMKDKMMIFLLGLSQNYALLAFAQR